MMIAEEQATDFKKDTVKSHRLSSDAPCQPDQKSPRGPRVALLTPYSGNNLGDAAIQDAMISNLRLRLSGAEFSGISLNCDNFVKRHGIEAFPLCASDQPFYGMSGGQMEGHSKQFGRFTPESGQKNRSAALIRRAVKRVPALWRCLKMIRTWATGIWREARHCAEGYRLLCRQDLLIVSGGGQLDDAWGGPWGHPFALLKWAILARIAHIPYVIASVGAGKVTSRTSRFFLSGALRMARYRSYRDENSKNIAAGLLQRAAGDFVVPDLAFSLPSSELPPPAGLRSISQGRTIIAISPIIYARPESWPYRNRALYDRYLQQMAAVLSELLERGDFVVVVRSALSDESVIPELVGCLDEKSKKRLAQQMHVPAITTWKDLVATLLDVDFLIASRLHSTIFGFVVQKPTVAISFDPKVDWVMEDLGQTDYLLQIRDFVAEDVLKTLDRISHHRMIVVEQIVSYQRRILAVSRLQYDIIAELLMASLRRRNGQNNVESALR
jgi:polysaccharide pyruvyl transferase WcaK-like protein